MKYPYLSFFALFLLSSMQARADRFVTGQSASSVLGQSDMNSAIAAGGRGGLSFPESVAVDPLTGKVFVADSGNYRILRFSSRTALANGWLPEAVIGQPDFTSVEYNQGGEPGPSTLGYIQQITVDQDGRLWVCDSGNNRVLCFFAASSLGENDNPPADLVFGQSGFDSVDPGRSASRTAYPSGVAVGPDGSLWVADTDNHRVLRFANAASRTEDAPAADSVLGQPGFDTGGFGVSATAMEVPFSVSVDAAGRLWVADTNNNRILRFDNAASLANGAPASAVLGQAAFNTAGSATSATGLDQPRGVLAGPDGTLYVADWTNSRVLGFRSAAAKPNGAAADFVLGKPDFVSLEIGPSATLLNGPGNLSLSPAGDLFVADLNDNRVLRFSPVKTPTVKIRTRGTVTRAAFVRVAGTASGQISAVTWRVGARGSFARASGTTSWSFKARLKRGRNVITVLASGPGGTSAPQSISVRRR